MKTHTENVTFEMEIPDGYRCIGYRPPVIGEYYLYGYEVCRAKTFNHSTAYLILEKVHVKPELLYIVALSGNHVRPVSPKQQFKVIGKASTAARYMHYDSLLIENEHGKWTGYGHWNDGPEESGQ